MSVCVCGRSFSETKVSDTLPGGSFGVFRGDNGAAFSYAGQGDSPTFGLAHSIGFSFIFLIFFFFFFGGMQETPLTGSVPFR